MVIWLEKRGMDPPHFFTWNVIRNFTPHSFHTPSPYILRP